jgi:hypothetical protein
MVNIHPKDLHDLNIRKCGFCFAGTTGSTCLILFWSHNYYSIGLKKYPNSFELHSNYAFFLTNIRENHDQAEEHYKKSLELEPDNAIVNGN